MQYSTIMAKEFNLKKTVINLTLALLLFLLVGSFLVTVTDLRFLSLVREILIVAILGLSFYHRKQNKIPFIQDDIERVMVWLLILSVISLLFVTQDFGAWFWSARYSLLPLAVFWSLHSYSKQDFEQETVTLVNRWVIAAIIITVLGLLMITVIPKETLVGIGYSADVAVGDGQWQAAAKLPAFQTVAGKIPRIQSTLTGPIQFAGFSILLFFLLPATRKLLKGSWYQVVVLLALIGVVATFSRAAWIALLLIALINGLKQLLKSGWKKLEIASVVIIVATAGSLVLANTLFTPSAESNRELIAQILTRDVSDREHVSSIADTVKLVPQIWPLGFGFGRSGAASIQNSNINVDAPEPRFVDNSYLRWFEELGLIGFILFLSMIILLIVELSKQRDDLLANSLALAGTGIAITAIFTDMWLEAVPVITFFALAGLAHKPHENISSKEVKLLGFKISGQNFADTKTQITGWSTHLAAKHIITLNPEMAYASLNNKELAKTIAQADLVTADGVGIRVAANYVQYKWPKWAWLTYMLAPFTWIYLFFLGVFFPQKIKPIPERVTGSDLTTAILEYANLHKQKLALLGSTTDVIAKAKSNIASRYPQVRVVYADPGPDIQENGQIKLDEVRKLGSQIKHAKPNYLLVAFGVPKQELFIARYKNELRVPVMIGVSGAFDSTLSRTVKRAPGILQSVNLEWLWRLIVQPKRFNRIITALIRFPLAVTVKGVKALDNMASKE